MNIASFHVQDDIVIVGQDPEMADMVNPRGLIHGHAAYIVATAPNGERRKLHVKTEIFAPDAREPAQKLCDQLIARLMNLGKKPVGFDRWQFCDAAYMSDAYDEMDTIEWERRVDEEERWL